MAVRKHGDSSGVVSDWVGSNALTTVLTLRVYRLADFFKYYSRDFSYNTAVVSIRAGAIQKDAKGWQGTVRPFSRRRLA